MSVRYLKRFDHALEEELHTEVRVMQARMKLFLAVAS